MSVVDREENPSQDSVAAFATIETTLTTAIESQDRSDSRTNTVAFTVAKNSAGTWKLWDVSTPTNNGVDDTIPAASFDFGYETESAGSGDGVLTITHTAGDSIEAASLFVRGAGLNTVGNEPSTDFSRRFDRIATGVDPSSSVRSGDRIQLQVMSDYEVQIVWEGPQSENATILAEDSGLGG
jgi:hypothetical protein